MSSFGVYTLANNVVYDQLVALLNSIEVNLGEQVPICIIPYDDRLDQIEALVRDRPNVTLYDNTEIIQIWEDFARDVWTAHPRAKVRYGHRTMWHKGHLQRKFAAFAGSFDKFLFYDSDSLAMKPADDVLEKLDTYDFVFDDWEHHKPTESAALNIDLIADTGEYAEAEIRSKLHCSSFFASKKGIFDREERDWLRERLLQHQEVTWINGKGWWDDAFLFNYMTLRCDRPLYNFTLSPNSRDRAGNCADADEFVEQDGVLYNKEGFKPIRRIHYMNYSATDLSRLSGGEDVNVRYREIFLHYRFLKEPEKKPSTLIPPSFPIRLQRRVNTISRKAYNRVSVLWNP